MFQCDLLEVAFVLLEESKPSIEYPDKVRMAWTSSNSIIRDDLECMMRVEAVWSAGVGRE